MKKIILVCGVLFTLVLSSGCTVTNVREHPALEEQLLDVDSVLVVTPAVSIEQINFASENERLIEMENLIQQELIIFAESELKERGYDVVEFDLEKAIAEDEQLAYAVNQAIEGFDEAKKTLYEKALTEEDKRKFKVSVGTAVNIVSEKSGADAVLLMHYIGQRKSEGSVAKDIAVGVLVGLLTGSVPVAPTEASYVEIAFIDGVTGEVLWSNMFSSQQLSIKIADDVMQSFPEDIDAPAKVAKSDKIQAQTVDTEAARKTDEVVN